MRLTYKQRLFLYFAIIFTLFTAGIFVFEQSRERRLRTEALEEKLDAYAEIINSSHGFLSLDSLEQLLPSNIRLTLIDNDGNVLYDNSVKDVHSLENHTMRPEVQAAIAKGRGSNIRMSASLNKEYLYYAKKIGNGYVRVALPYDIQTRRFLEPDNLFLYFILAFFFIILILLNAITNRFGKSIRQLRDFVMTSDSDKLPKLDFPNDELGQISTKLVENYKQLRRSQKRIALEREKLLQHVHSSEEGICFFSADRNVEFYNGLFIQYLNTISSEPNSNPKEIFSDSAFDELNDFLSREDKEENYFEIHIRKHGRLFILRLNIFEDRSFEIVLNDMTEEEKTRLLKQEMTSNIAHELRTPVTSIRGYLETVLVQSALDENKKQHFISKAYNQTIILSELIGDMSLITKIEEAPTSFRKEEVNIYQLLNELNDDLATALQSKNIVMTTNNIPEGLAINGNRSLLYSIFRNLVDNTIRYAGEDVTICVSVYNEDKDYYYFSFYDTGVGISDEKHLKRLFERFYRVNEGRTRDTGGSGLGLSIVKNAIAFHNGSIIAKNRKEGGLEFLFKLKK